MSKNRFTTHWAIDAGDWCISRFDWIRTCGVEWPVKPVLVVLWIIFMVPAAYAFSAFGFYVLNRRIDRASMDELSGSITATTTTKQ